MTIKLHPKAEEDLSDALNYYYAIDEKLEAKFLKYLELTFDKILQFTNLYPYENEVAQKITVEKFPYIVLYEQYEDIVMILAIFHTKRDSNELISRV